MSEYREHDYAVVELCMKIHESFTGSGDPLSDEDLRRCRSWLVWRLSDGWIAPKTPRQKLFDDVVRSMAMAAIDEANEELCIHGPTKDGT